MSSEFLVKQTLIKIIENAKFDYERENYKWFKLNFLNDDRKSFAGDYDMRTHIIRVFVPKTSAKTNANLICTTLHEVSHHIDVYAMLAETELQRKTKRQQEGLIAMKERGEWDNYGRHRVMSLPDFEKEYQNVKDGKIKSLELMRKLNMKKSTYFKYVREIKLMDGNCTD